jgi:AraC-like DNA-binding protein
MAARAARPPEPRIRAWRPDVPGVAEVLHAHFPRHAYPMHTHDAWALLVVDAGAVHYGLDRHEHDIGSSLVTLLPPYVAHDGRSLTPDGFRKRVVYLEPDRIDTSLLGRAVDHPGWSDPSLRSAVHRLHAALGREGEELEAESRLALVTDRLARLLAREPDLPRRGRSPATAGRLRDLLEARTVEGVRLDEASRLLGAEPTYLLRAFRDEYGVPPHRYLTGRRLADARRRLLAGERPVDVAVAVGFYDQAHLSRHFKQLLGVTPGVFAASASHP